MKSDSRIFTLLTNYFQKLCNEFGDRNVPSTIKTLWETTDNSHRHLILDMIASSQAKESQRNTSTWGRHRTASNAKHPKLAVVMTALETRVPLTESPGYRDTFFTPEERDELAHEINEQNQWRNNNPYYCGGGFIPDIQIPEAGEAVARTLTDGLYDLRQDILLILLAPMEAAPTVINYAHNYERIDRKNLPIEAFPGVVEFWHQQKLYNERINIIAIGLGHLSPTTVEKYLTSMGTDGFVSDDYKEWADTLENLFPLREKALEWVMTGTGYCIKSNWEKENLTGKSDSIITEIDDRPSRDYLPITTQQWLLEQRKPTLTYHTDTYTL